jgi:hypothetical protein
MKPPDRAKPRPTANAEERRNFTALVASMPAHEFSTPTAEALAAAS